MFRFSVFLLCSFVNLFSQPLYFNKLTKADGLSNNLIYDVLQDRTGFIWFGTDDGLNSYNGYTFQVFRNDPKDENTISDNSVWALCEDDSGKLWMGTKSGWLNCYDPVYNKFSKWKISSDISLENSITYIIEDSRNKIWFGTYRSGLYFFDPSTGGIRNWRNNGDDDKSLSSNFVSSILEDNLGRIWIGTYNGLNVINPGHMESGFVRFFNQPGRTDCLSDNLVWQLSQSPFDSDLIWIGTANGLTTLRTDNMLFTQKKLLNPEELQFGFSTGTVIEEIVDNEKIIWIDSYAGLVYMNEHKGIIERFVSDKNSRGSLVSNRINRMIKDRTGNLWLATSNGVNYLPLKSAEMHTLTNKLDFQGSSELDKINITAISKTGDSRLWFGTDDGLFNTYKTGNRTLVEKFKGANKLNVWCLAPGINDELWIGTYGQGLYKLDSKQDIIKKIPVDFPGSRTRSVDYIKSAYYDDENNLWLGFWGAGLGRLSLKDGSFKFWLNDPSNSESLSFNDVWTIYQDSRNSLWVGTNGGGLNLLADRENGIFYHWNAEEKRKFHLSSNSIYSICESKVKTGTESSDEIILWVGTSNGLNRLTLKYNGNPGAAPEVTGIKRFTVDDGLADNSVKSIIEDNNGDLWLGTSSGISMYSIKSGWFVNYNNILGTESSDFNYSSAFSNDNGILFMGSNSGLSYFCLKNSPPSDINPTVVITDFQIFNKSVIPGKNSPLQKNIHYTDQITLFNDQNVFSFQFAALDYSSHGSVQYSYIMEGFDADWIKCGNRRFATYTNLNPGEYIFKVKSTNGEGIWNSSYAEIKVNILPPWWQTAWAIGLYIVVFILGAWGIIRFQINRVSLRHELKMREFESHHLREIESMKSRFFANLSHEFRTPLMLIKGPLEQLISGRVKINLTEYYKMILRNAEKLQKLIDEMLELSQLEAESIPLHKQQQDIVKLVKSFTSAFIPAAEQSRINLSFNSSVENIVAMIDKEKLEKIITNLLSNAFKFTPDGGKISVEVSLDKQEKSGIATVAISDTGMGIPEEHRSKVFDRFYQIDDSTKRNYGGSGIGLALVKELVSLQNWNISVFSKVGVGTVFTLRIPVEKQPEEKTEPEESSFAVFSEQPENSAAEKLIGSLNPEENRFDWKKDEKPVILLIEDSTEVRNYVSELLSSNYRVYAADGGEEGLELALHHMPELIISDVMMDGMDGFEFCRRIKTDWQTSHIPVILLTARATKESKIEGLETGADDFITKPFSYDELAARIRNLIDQRRKLKEKFSRELNIKSETVVSNPVDKEFLDNIISVLEKNLSNENFDSEMLAEKIHVSRRQLHRKLQAVSGQAPGEFIRLFKLKRAARMLIENNFGVTQIAFEVGFGSPSQFTKAFKKYFGCLPSVFKEKHGHKYFISG